MIKFLGPFRWTRASPLRRIQFLHEKKKKPQLMEYLWICFLILYLSRPGPAWLSLCAFWCTRFWPSSRPAFAALRPAVSCRASDRCCIVGSYSPHLASPIWIFHNNQKLIRKKKRKKNDNKTNPKKKEKKSKKKQSDIEIE